jgi:hypothetical protein
MRNTWAAITVTLLALAALWILVELTSHVDGGLLVVEAWAALFGFLAIATGARVLRLARAVRVTHDASVRWFLDGRSIVARRADQPITAIAIGEAAHAELTAIPKAAVLPR